MILGGVLLLFGRRLYRPLVALVGFLLGWTLLDRLAIDVSAEAAFLFAGILGIGGAILALAVQRLALAITGFVLGGLGTLWLFDAFGHRLEGPQALLLLVGAMIGLVAFQRLFEAALVVASAFAGAGLIVSASSLTPPASLGLLAGLFVVGLFSQRRKSASETRARRRRRRAVAAPET